MELFLVNGYIKNSIYWWTTELLTVDVFHIVLCNPNVICKLNNSKQYEKTVLLIIIIIFDNRHLIDFNIYDCMWQINLIYWFWALLAASGEEIK